MRNPLRRQYAKNSEDYLKKDNLTKFIKIEKLSVEELKPTDIIVFTLRDSPDQEEMDTITEDVRRWMDWANMPNKILISAMDVKL